MQGILLASQAVESLAELCGLGCQPRLLSPRLEVGAAFGKDVFRLGELTGEQLDIRRQARVVGRDVHSPAEFLVNRPRPGREISSEGESACH